MAVSMLRARRPLFENPTEGPERGGESDVQTEGSIQTATGANPEKEKASPSPRPPGPRLLHFTEEEIKGLEPYLDEKGEVILEVTGRFERDKEADSVVFNVENVGYAPDSGGGDEPSVLTAAMGHARAY